MAEWYNCAVVTVCLRPTPVSPESACFGVIVKCDGGGFFGYKLAQGDERAIERIAGFFPRYGRDNVVRAMEWAAHDIDFAIEGEKEGRAAFQNLIRPRENVIRDGAPFVVATDNPASELVGSYDANIWGFYDMHGNVWEWCNDWYGAYPSGSVTDPSGPASGDGRVQRGGDFRTLVRLLGCGSAFRTHSDPSNREDSYGFRLCCSAEPHE